MKSSHGWDVFCKTGARATSPARKAVQPGCRRRLSTRWSTPRRRSASTSNVRCFAYENASARLELTNDFPSPRPGLVTVTTIEPRERGREVVRQLQPGAGVLIREAA